MTPQVNKKDPSMLPPLSGNRNVQNYNNGIYKLPPKPAQLIPSSSRQQNNSVISNNNNIHNLNSSR